MAAVLEKNHANGKPMILADKMEYSERIQCSGCSVSYTMAYGATEHLIQGVIRHAAHNLLSETHPAHEVEMYVWGGIYKGWLDKGQAKAAGL